MSPFTLSWILLINNSGCIRPQLKLLTHVFMLLSGVSFTDLIKFFVS